MKITVAIPTIGGRSHYLRACLRTCVTQDSDFEILVSENSDGEARAVVDAYNDPRIRYVRPATYLPMSAHWDFVLSQIDGDMVTFIGDDDGLMPDCIRRVRALSAEVPATPIHHAFANYCWPDFIHPRQRNTVLFMHAAGEGFHLAQCDVFLKSVAQGRARYVDGPMVYHNFVPTTLLHRMTAEGKFFRRSSPDLYSAIAIAANTPLFLSTREVLTLSGQGAKANGAAVQAGQGRSFLAEAQALYAPRYKGRSIQMALLDALLEVAEHFGRPDLSARIDYAAHFAAAALEARWISRDARVQEITWAFEAAGRHGVRTSTLAALARDVYRRFGHGTTSSEAKPLFISGQTIDMPTGTSTIFEATQALAEILRSHQQHVP
jgi:glycosyltransferase involved in cell wall biosynthesis